MKKASIGNALAAILIAAFSFSAACSNPLEGQRQGKCDLTVVVGSGGARTIVPDFAALVDNYDITLTSNESTPYPSRTVTNKPANHTFTALESGSWNVSVKAKKGTVQIASGASVVSIGAAASATVSVALAPIAMSGTGDFSLSLELPKSTGIDKLYWQVVTSVGEDLFGASGDVTFDPANGPDPMTATIAKTDIAAGKYTVKLTFMRGLNGAGAFRESLNVWNGIASDKWVAADGTLVAKRMFLADEFFDGNASLSGLDILRDGSAVSVPEGASGTPYDVGNVPSGGVRFKPTQGIGGQTISYSLNSSGYSAIASGAMSDVLALSNGLNTLQVKVTAPNRVATKTYTVTMTGIGASGYVGTSSIGMEMTLVPGVAYPRNSNDQTQVGKFLLGKHLVTQAQYNAVMGANPSYFQGVNVPGDDTSRPVENLTWYDAVEFCNKLSALDGLEPVYYLTGRTPATGSITSATVTADFRKNGYRLPSWSEIVSVAFRSYNDAFVTDLPNAGVDMDNVNDSAVQAWLRQHGCFSDQAVLHNSVLISHPVGRLRPNTLGMYDLFGNVSQWLHDRGSIPGGSGSTTNYSGDGAGNSMYYGGSVGFPVSNGVLVGLIDGVAQATADTANRYIGFRVARSVPMTVTYLQDSSVTSGWAPVDPTRYLEFDPVTINKNAGNDLRGPIVTGHEAAGITQRLIGWNTTANSTASTHVAGASVPHPASELKLYPVWSDETSVLRKVGPAGGWVFYDAGNFSSGWRYLEVALQDLSNAMPAGGLAAPSMSTQSFTGIGTGKTNTSIVFANLGTSETYGARLCREYRGGGYSDWFLPSSGELVQIYTGLNIAGLGPVTYGFQPYSSTLKEFYLSSSMSGGNPGTVLGVYMYNGVGDAGGVGNPYSCRPIRAFATRNPMYGVAYSPNDAASGTPTQDFNSYEAGTSVTLMGQGAMTAPSANKDFAGWNTKADLSGRLYATGGPVLGNANLTLYAHFSAKLVRVAGTGVGGSMASGNPTDTTISASVLDCAMDGVKMYIADTGNHVVRKLEAGTLSTFAGVMNLPGYIGDGSSPTAAQLYAPSGVAVNSSGHIFIADTGNNRIRKIDQGLITTVVGNGDAASSDVNGPALSTPANAPKKLAVNATTGDVYFTERNHVKYFNPASGNVFTVTGADDPDGIALDADGNVYFAEMGGRRIRKYTLANALTSTIAGSDSGMAGYSGDGGPATSALFGSPRDIAIDATGNIYVTDSQYHVIRRIDKATGKIMTIAGTGVAGSSGADGDDGTAIRANLKEPSGLCFDIAGNLYYSGYGSVRKILLVP